MADLGDLIGSLMAGLIRARHVADEQTAALAEQYRDNPLLEGLSVPRIRVPELTIDMPFLIEDDVPGRSGRMAEPAKIAEVVGSQLVSASSANSFRASDDLRKVFVTQVKTRLARIKKTGDASVKEAVARTVQDAFTDALARSKVTLTNAQKESISKDLRAAASAASVVREPVMPSIVANIKTADVKERASSTNVVRLKITLKEEGLEWAVQASESGGVVRKLQPE